MTTGREAAALTAYFLQPLKEQNREGHLPLHAAAKQTGEHGLAVVKELIRLYPGAARKPDSHGFLPLHYAACCQDGDYGVRVVKELLNAYPNAVREADKTGKLPLQLAEKNSKLPQAGKQVLRDAADGTWPTAASSPASTQASAQANAQANAQASAQVRSAQATKAPGSPADPEARAGELTLTPLIIGFSFY